MSTWDDVQSWYGLQADMIDAQIADMFWPVRCTHCQEIYDAGKVTVTARYLDCSCWVSPCCKRQVDDRKPPWKHRADVEELRR